MEEVVIVLTRYENGTACIRVDKQHGPLGGICNHLAHIAFQAMNREIDRLEKEGSVLGSGDNAGRMLL